MHSTYQLHILVNRPLSLEIGRLGQFAFAAGDYLYTGSARRNLAARLARHYRAEKRLQWHIDYLLTAAGVELCSARTCALGECDLNRRTAGEIVVPRFGASDCRAGCGSHLKYLGKTNQDIRAAGCSVPSSIEPEQLRLHPASRDDADHLAAMALDIWHRHYVPGILDRAEVEYLWQRSYRPQALRQQMRAGASFQWIEHRHEPVGFLSYRLEPAAQRLWLTKLYVLPEFHLRGIGAYALAAVKRAAAALGAIEIRLYVFRRNERAIRAYRRAGFAILCEDYSDAGNGFFYDDYVMNLRLDADHDHESALEPTPAGAIRTLS